MPKRKPTYSNLKRDLDAVIEKLQSEETDIDDAVELYKKANKIIGSLNEYLDKVKLEIEHLKNK